MHGASARPARPGQRPCVVVDLGDLRGPADGILELPIDVCWSLPVGRRRFDLSDPDQVAAAYEFVLDAASQPGHLIPYLHPGLLAAAWPDLGMPRAKRLAWEAANPQLRARGTATAA
jgi:hypothetical protein